MGLRENTIQHLKDRRQRLLDGKVNSIPSPFPRFSEDFIGVEQATYTAVTSFTKGGKTQFASYVFVFMPILFAYTHKDIVKVTILYFALEESPERIMERFMSFLLFLKYQKRISPRDLRSSKNDRPVPQDILDLLDSEELTSIQDFFEQNVIFYEDANPTGIKKIVTKYAEEHGKTEYKSVIIKDEFGRDKEVKMFSSYEANDPNEYVIPFIDTMNLIEPEKDQTLKIAMDETSKFLRKARNRYRYSPVVIQQQAFDGEGIENIKLNKVRPSVAGLGDSKYIGRDANIILGLFSPARFDLPEYLGYNITKFRDNIRFLEVIVNRDGEMGGIVALFFDGAVCNFQELPPAADGAELSKYYTYLKSIRQPVQQGTFFAFTPKKNKNGKNSSNTRLKWRWKNHKHHH